MGNNNGGFSIKGNQTYRQFNKYETIQQPFDQSFNNSPTKMSFGRHKSPKIDRTLLLRREIDIEELNLRHEILSMTGTIRSSHDLINEAKRSNNQYSGFKNRLSEKQKNSLLKGRNSMNIINNPQMIQSENLKNKKHSIVPSYLVKEKVFRPPQTKIINLNCEQFENDTVIQNELLHDSPNKQLEIDPLVTNNHNGYELSGTDPDERPINPDDRDISVSIKIRTQKYKHSHSKLKSVRKDEFQGQKSHKMPKDRKKKVESKKLIYKKSSKPIVVNETPQKRKQIEIVPLFQSSVRESKLYSSPIKNKAN